MWELVGSLNVPNQVDTPVLSPPSHLESCKRKDLKFNTCSNGGTRSLCDPQRLKASSQGLQLPSTLLYKICQWSHTCSPHHWCHQSIKSFCLSHRMRFLASSWLAGRALPLGAGAQVHSHVHTGAGVCRCTERWKRPDKALQTAPIKLFLKYLKQA